GKTTDQILIHNAAAALGAQRSHHTHVECRDGRFHAFEFAEHMPSVAQRSRLALLPQSAQTIYTSATGTDKVDRWKLLGQKIGRFEENLLALDALNAPNQPHNVGIPWNFPLLLT